MSLSSGRAATAVTAEERPIPVFEGRKVKGREKKKKEAGINEEMRQLRRMLADINLVHVTLTLGI